MFTKAAHGATPMILPARFEIFALFGKLELDLRGAYFRAGEVTEIVVSAKFSSVEIRLPRDVAADSEGVAVLARFTSRAPSSSAAPGVPIVRISGRALISTVAFT